MSSKNEDDFQLERFLEQTLSSIPKEYQDDNFSHVAVVARALKSNVNRNPHGLF